MPELIPEVQKSATFSPCRRYRYVLTRRWGDGPALAVIGLNPSVADEFIEDPTIRRCIGFARTWGMDTLVMLNLFAFRATDPEVMKAEASPIGLLNDEHIRFEVSRAKVALAAWGVHGTWIDRARKVLEMLGPQLHCLGTTRDGHPRHPLYVRASQQPLSFRW